MKSIIVKVMAGFLLFTAGAAVAVPVCRMYDKSRAAEEAAVVSGGSEDPVDNGNSGVAEGNCSCACGTAIWSGLTECAGMMRER